MFRSRPLSQPSPLRTQSQRPAKPSNPNANPVATQLPTKSGPGRPWSNSHRLRAFTALYLQRRRRKRRGEPVPFEDYLLGDYGANLKAFFPLAFDIKDQSVAANHGYSYSGVTFGGPTPPGFKYPICAKFDGAASIRKVSRTISCGLVAVSPANRASNSNSVMPPKSG